MTITRDQVAKRANVSSATVSRVFNNPQLVSPTLCNAVREAAKELGYTPNKAAGLLRRRGTGVIAFVEIQKEQRPYYWGDLTSFDWFFGRSIRGVQAAIKESSWQVRFYKIRGKKELQAIESQCDGILAYDVDTQQEVELFCDISVPYVLAHHVGKEAAPSVVVTDNYIGGRVQAEFLKKQGCKNPLYITGFLDSVPPHKERLEGFLSLFPNAIVVETEIGTPQAVESILHKIEEEEKKGRIDSLAVVNDLTLFELLLTSRSTLCSVGYDGSPFFRLLRGNLATVDLQSGEIYKKATLHLISMLEGGAPTQEVVPPVLVTLQYNQKNGEK